MITLRATATTLKPRVLGVSTRFFFVFSKFKANQILRLFSSGYSELFQRLSTLKNIENCRKVQGSKYIRHFLSFWRRTSWYSEIELFQTNLHWSLWGFYLKIFQNCVQMCSSNFLILWTKNSRMSTKWILSSSLYRYSRPFTRSWSRKESRRPPKSSKFPTEWKMESAKIRSNSSSRIWA